MKHNTKITTIILLMFFITQLIGLFIINFYDNNQNKIPYDMQPSNEIQSQSITQGITYIILMFTFTIIIFIALTKIKAEIILRLWFFLVVALGLGITLTAILYNLNINNSTSLIALSIAAVLSFFKIYKKNLIVHNLTELLIYPGVATIFVFFLFMLFKTQTILGIIILLLIISLYDIWAVWHSEFMQKMANYQINNLKFFTGFFIPYADKKTKQKIKTLKQKYTTEEELQKNFKKSKLKINLAILGGGDIIFPLITAGIFLKTYSVIPALIITVFSTLALLFLFILARKGKFYPAMPFLTIGIYLGMILSWIII